MKNSIYMYKITLNKDIEFRSFEYKEGETYQVSRKVKEFLKRNNAIQKTKKKSKKEETPKDLQISN